MKKTCILLAAIASVGIAGQAGAQALGVIRGTVTTAAGVPLPRVNVVIEGTRIGTQTADDGRFIVRTAPGSYTLRASVLGYSPQSKPVQVAAGETTVDFQLAPLALQLDAVVSTGYRMQAKATVTGAVTSVTAEEFKDIPVDNLSNALAGRLSGAAIQQNAGTPGRESSIRVRAVGTFNNSNPLFVIDGVVSDKFTFDGLSTHEVESVSILKDGAAASVYGSRAANGVILVTTNRGRMGAPQFAYTGTVGLQTPTRMPDALNAYEQGRAINDYLAYLNIPRNDARYFTNDELDYYKGVSHDWLKALWKDPRSMQHSLNITGGAGAARYFLSGSVLDETGSFDNLAFKRYTTRGNLDIDITSGLKASVDLSSTYRDRDGPSWGGDDWGHEDLYAALRLRSQQVPPYINGLPVGNWVEWHPGSVVRYEGGYDKRDWAEYKTKFRLDYQIPKIEGLKASASFFKGFNIGHRKQFNLPYQMALFNTTGTNNHIVGTEQVGWRDRVQAEFLMNREDRENEYQLNTQLDYRKAFGKHNVDGFLVYEQAETDSAWFSGRRDSFISPVIDQFIGGAVDQAQANGSERKRARLSYVGSLNYDYAEKYFLTGSFRYDGSVIFAPENRWGFFPAMSAGWRVSEEPFFKWGFIDDLKLRASYGVLGNDQVGAFQWMQRYSIANGAIFTTPTTGIQPGTLANRDMTWEKSKSYNVGLDSRFWKNRLNLTVDVFRRNTYDILGDWNEAVPSTFGASLPDKNYQEINSKGFEVEFGYDNRFGEAKRPIGYYVKGNFGYATNEIVRLNEAQNIRRYQSRKGRTTATEAQCFGLVATGILRTPEDIAALPAGYTIEGRAPQLGMMNFRDLRGTVTDEPDGRITNDDREWLCDYASPPMTFGLNIGGAWKRLRVDALFNGGAGHHHMMHSFGRVITNRQEVTSYGFWRDAWSPENPNGKYPGLKIQGNGSTSNPSSFWVRDASFVRFKNLSVSYELPDRLTSPVGASGARLYFAGTNLALLYDKFDEWQFDPEMNNIRAYPLMRTFSVGLDLTVRRR